MTLVKLSSSIQAKVASTDGGTLLRRRRGGVCGDSLGPDQLRDWAPPVHHKSSGEQKTLIESLDNHPMLFGHLHESERLKVITAMRPMEVKAGEILIQQGDIGDYFYIVESGNFEISVQREPDGPSEVVLKVGAGGSFGELALLYGAQRAATVRAVTDAHVWALWRDDFRFMLVTAENTKKKRWEWFLSQIPIFSCMNEYERGQVSDIMKTMTYYPGECIVRQGEHGELFFILEGGEAVCVMTKDNDDEDVFVKCYEKGDYFGELALIYGGVRQASVFARGFCNVLTIEKTTFDRVMGPILNKLKESACSYPTYEGMVYAQASSFEQENLTENEPSSISDGSF